MHSILLFSSVINIMNNQMHITSTGGLLHCSCIYYSFHNISRLEVNMTGGGTTVH